VPDGRRNSLACYGAPNSELSRLNDSFRFFFSLFKPSLTLSTRGGVRSAGPENQRSWRLLILKTRRDFVGLDATLDQQFLSNRVPQLSFELLST
jgi:hypothetical protein